MTKSHNESGLYEKIENLSGSGDIENDIISEKEFISPGRCSYDLNAVEIKILSGSELNVKILNRNSQEIKPEEIVVAIDGGWGWMVVLGSFFSNFFVDGIIYSYGLKTEAILESFKETGQNSVDLSEIGWIISLLNAFYGFGGPLAAALANRFGFRIVAIIGSITTSFGFGLTYFFCRIRPNLYVLFLVNGVICGLGASLMFIPSVIAVGFYFEKHRALATAISVCGSGLGQTVFGTLEFYLIAHLGWKETLVVEAGLFLCVCIPASLYRPLRPDLDTIAQAPPVSSTQGETNVRKISTKSAGTFILPYIMSRHNVGSREDFNNREDSERMSAGTGRIGGEMKGPVHTRIGHSIVAVDESIGTCKLRSYVDIQTINSPLFRDDILYPGSMQRIPAYAETVGSGVLSSKEWCVVVAGDGASASVAQNGKQKHRGKLFKSFRKLFNVEILTNYSFILITLSGVLNCLAFLVPYAYLPSMAVQNRQQKADVKMFFTVMGASSTISRILCGVIADLPTAKPAIMLATALAIGGVSTLLLPFCTNYWLFIGYSVAYGLTGAFRSILPPIIIVELMSLENLTNAYGYLCVFGGLAKIISTPFAGFLYEYTGSFTTSFVVAGTMLLLASIVLLPSGCLHRWEIERKNRYA